MGYNELKAAFLDIDFASDNAWSKWNAKNLRVIREMFGYLDHIPPDDIADDWNGDRQSNQLGGAKLFVVSQSEKNPYRFSRIRAYNGTFVPVVSLDCLTTHFCSTLGTLLNQIKIECKRMTKNWSPQLLELWRMEPHGNWHGDLPERKIPEGERTWYKNNRTNQAYPMNEWQILGTGRQVYPFDQKLATDPGAIRIVSVSSARYWRGANWNAAPPDPVQPEKLAKLVEGKEEGPYYITGVKYTAQAGVRKDADTKKLVGVASNTTKKNPDPTAFKARLYNRKPIRFYFSFNHYRTILIHTNHGDLILNPWFAIAED
jgi:hypothetical protein